jgi:hypothetical protein
MTCRQQINGTERPASGVLIYPRITEDGLGLELARAEDGRVVEVLPISPVEAVNRADQLVTLSAEVLRNRARAGLVP